MANKRPDLLKSLTSISIPYDVRVSKIVLRCPGYLMNAWYMTFFQLLGIADWVVRRNDYAFIGMLYRQWCPAWNDKDRGERIASAKKTLSQPGAMKRALGYYRNSLVGLTPDSFEFRSRYNDEIQVPTLGLRGVEDRCIPEVAWELLSVKSFRAGLLLLPIEGAAHFPQLEAPDAVNRVLVRWLGEHDA